MLTALLAPAGSRLHAGPRLPGLLFPARRRRDPRGPPRGAGPARCTVEARPPRPGRRAGERMWRSTRPRDRPRGAGVALSPSAGVARSLARSCCDAPLCPPPCSASEPAQSNVFWPLRGVVATPPSAPLRVRPASLPSPMFSGLCEELLRRPRPAAGSRPHLRCACHAHGVSREDCHAPPSPPAFFLRSAPRGFVRLPRAPLASCVFSAKRP